MLAVSQNNPDETQHIGVIVPGMTTSVAGNGKDGSIADYDLHATTMREAAEKAAGPGQKVAMVSFFGYDAPPGLIQASNTDMAQAGATKLANFLTGIDAAREHGAGDAHITVASRSYGSTTAGIAATLVGDGVIDDLVQFGSPGSGVQDVGEFHVPEGHMYVSAAPYLHDVVQGVGPDGSFGKNPDTMDGYKHLSGDVGPAPRSYRPWDRHTAATSRRTPRRTEILPASLQGILPHEKAFRRPSRIFFSYRMCRVRTDFSGGTMNPFSPQVKSIEAFQRDLEPTIISARNELLTAENFMAYKEQLHHLQDPGGRKARIFSPLTHVLLHRAGHGPHPRDRQRTPHPSRI